MARLLDFLILSSLWDLRAIFSIRSISPDNSSEWRSIDLTKPRWCRQTRFKVVTNVIADKLLMAESSRLSGCD
jgi:hypothetical protein